MAQLEREKALLSIVIPHRNHPEKLRRLLGTIDIETLDLIDVYVIDDSSDSSRCANLIEEEFPEFCFLENKTGCANAGSARNVGISALNSTWVMFADSDDYFVPGAFSTILSSLREAEWLVDLIFFNVCSWNDDRGREGNRHRHISNLIGNPNLRDSNRSEKLRFEWPVPWGKAVRVSMISKFSIRFDSVPAANDVIFSQLCGYYAREIRCYSDVVYCVTESSNSLTAVLNPDRALARLDVLTRANSNFLLWDKLNYLKTGFQYFMASEPWILTRHKVMVYGKYIYMQVKRAKAKLRFIFCQTLQRKSLKE